MRTGLKNTLMFAVLGIAAFIVSGCYTIEGAGRDVESIGAGLADTADRTRPYE